MTTDELARRADDLPRGSRPGRGPVRKIVIGTGLAAYSWAAGATAPFSADASHSPFGPHPLKSAAVLIWLLAGWGLVRR